MTDAVDEVERATWVLLQLGAFGDAVVAQEHPRALALLEGLELLPVAVVAPPLGPLRGELLDVVMVAMGAAMAVVNGGDDPNAVNALDRVVRQLQRKAPAIRQALGG